MGGQERHQEGRHHGVDYAPGIDAENSFKDAFTKAGGEVLQTVRFPLANPDFSPFLQRAADAKPDAIFVFLPSGRAAPSSSSSSSAGSTRPASSSSARAT